MRVKKLKKFFPYSRQSIDKKDIKQVTDVLKSDFITQGPRISEFEKSFAKYVNAKYAVSCATGTAALHLACMALGLTKGHNLVTSPITFVASANCAQYLGAKTIFVDIENKSNCICPIRLEKLLKTKKIHTVVVVHMAGHSADMKKIYSLKKKYKFNLIEDACHALGGSIYKKKVGSCSFSDISTFSFHPVKPITTGEGGMITTNNKRIYEKLLLLRTHGITKERKKFKNKKLAFDKKGNQNLWYYEMLELGYNFRITDLQASLGQSQLKKLDSFIKTRKSIAKIYDQKFISNPLIKIPVVAANVSHAYHLYTILINFKAINKSRNEIMEKLRKCNIGSQVLYIPVNFQTYYRKKYNFKEKDFPRSLEYYKSCLSIPIFVGMKKKDAIFIADRINQIVKIDNE
tara:strand:- start:2229 stop:3437 length:1209 start_codon:yes stop_codon:yes gene_type:complete